MLTEQFLNSCLSLSLNHKSIGKVNKSTLRDIIDILEFYKQKEKNDIPIPIKNKLECLEVICKLRAEDRTTENIIDSISQGEKYKPLLEFITLKMEEDIPENAISDNIEQIRIRKKLMNLFYNYDKISEFLETVKTGSFKSLDDITFRYESFVKNMYTRLMECNRTMNAEATSSLDLIRDDYDSIIDIIKKKTSETNLVKTGFHVFDNSILQGGFEKGRLYIFAGGSGCVDKDTEFFNGHGWKKISDWNKDDLVLQYNEDGSTSLVYPDNYIKKDCEEFNLIESKYGLSIAFCDNHNHIYVDERKKNKLLRISSNDLLKRHNNTKSGFKGRFLTTFGYDASGINLTNSEIRLCVATIADGYFRNNSNLVVVKVKKDRKKTRLISLLNECNIEYEIKNYKSGYSNFYFDAPLNHKKFNSDYWYNCNIDQIKIICDEVLKWDGDNKNRYFTNDKESADFIQFAFTCIGKRSSIYTDDRTGQEYYVNNTKYIRKNKTYTVNVCKNNTVSFVEKHKKNIDRIKSIDNKKYCFTVPSSMLVLRRNNNIFITGNSGKSTLMTNFIENGLLDENKAKKPEVYVYITLENSVDETLMRMYQSMFKVTKSAFAESIRELDSNHIKGSIIQRIGRSNRSVIMKYFPKFSISPADVSMVIDDAISQYGSDGIRAVIVDYLDLLKLDSSLGKNYDLYRLELSHITSNLKDIAVSYNVPLITASQLTRSVYDKNPDSKELNLAMMSEAVKKIEHADFVALMSKDKNNDNTVYMNVGKNRCGAANKCLELKVDFVYYKFLTAYESGASTAPNIKTDQNSGGVMKFDSDSY